MPAYFAHTKCVIYSNIYFFFYQFLIETKRLETYSNNEENDTRINNFSLENSKARTKMFHLRSVNKTLIFHPKTDASSEGLLHPRNEPTSIENRLSTPQRSSYAVLGRENNQFSPTRRNIPPQQKKMYTCRGKKN